MRRGAAAVVGGTPGAGGITNANGSEKEASKGRSGLGGTIRRKSGGTETHEAKRSRARHLVSRVIGD